MWLSEFWITDFYPLSDSNLKLFLQLFFLWAFEVISTLMACCLVLIPRCQVVGEADREKHPAVWHAGSSGQSGSYDGSERREKRLGSQPSLGEGLPGKCKNHSSNKINPGYLCCFSAHRVRIGCKIICFGIYFDLWKTLDLFDLYLSKKIGHLRYEIFHKFVSIHLNMQRWGNTRTHTYMHATLFGE